MGGEGGANLRSHLLYAKSHPAVLGRFESLVERTSYTESTCTYMF